MTSEKSTRRSSALAKRPLVSCRDPIRTGRRVPVCIVYNFHCIFYCCISFLCEECMCVWSWGEGGLDSRHPALIVDCPKWTTACHVRLKENKIGPVPLRAITHTHTHTNTGRPSLPFVLLFVVEVTREENHQLQSTLDMQYLKKVTVKLLSYFSKTTGSPGRFNSEFIYKFDQSTLTVALWSIFKKPSSYLC